MSRIICLLLLLPMPEFAQTPLTEQWTQRGHWIKTLSRGNNCKAVITYEDRGDLHEEIWLNDVKLVDLTRHRLVFTNVEPSLEVSLIDYDQNGSFDSFEHMAISKKTGEKIGVWGEISNLVEVFERKADGSFQQISDTEFNRHKEQGAINREMFLKNPKGRID